MLYARKAVRSEVLYPGIKLRRKDNARDGLKMQIPTKKNICALRMNSVKVREPEIWNSLPIDLREI